jgi:hypothetical protein
VHLAVVIILGVAILILGVGTLVAWVINMMEEDENKILMNKE